MVLVEGLKTWCSTGFPLDIHKSILLHFLGFLSDGGWFGVPARICLSWQICLFWIMESSLHDDFEVYSMRYVYHISYSVGPLPVLNEIVAGRGPPLYSIHRWYCWWTKSCTTKDDDYPSIYRVLTIPVGAGFRPSTVLPAGLRVFLSIRSFPSPHRGFNKSSNSARELKGQEMWWKVTLQGINIAHLGKRKIIFKIPFFWGYVSSLEGSCYLWMMLMTNDG